MGWCSGTGLFDDITEAIFESSLPEEKQIEVIRILIKELEDGDWDCQQDSVYYEHPIVQRVFQEIHPHWFEDED